MDDFETEDSIDAEASDFLEAEIPSKLWDKVDKCFTRIMVAQVERKFSGKWRTLRKRLRFGNNGPPASTSVESVCTQLIEMVQADTKSRDEEGAYRAVFTVKDTDAAKGTRRLYCPIQTELGPDGDIVVSDSDEDSGRENQKFLLNVISQQTIRTDALFDRSMQLMDKNIDQATAMGTIAKDCAEGTAGVARSLQSVVTAATGALEKAGQLFQAREEETTAVQLAKLDQQLELQKLGAVTALLAKIGGPLGAQIAATLGGKKAPVQGKTAAALAAGQQGQATQADAGSSESAALVAAEQSPPVGAPAPKGICQRLKAWIADLSDNHKKGLSEIVGQKAYESFLAASISGEDVQAWEALSVFKVDFDKRAEVNQAEIYGKLVQITQLLGEDLAARFGHLLPESEG